MIIQNLSTVYPTTYLKKDNLILDISTRMSLKEVYEKILADENISESVVINAYRRTGEDVLFVPYRPPFDEMALGMQKVTVADFEGYMYGKQGYADYFTPIPVMPDNSSGENGLTKRQLLDYLSSAMEILPELEDKQSLSLEDKLALSETGKLFYENTVPISPFNPLPSYEELVFYNSLSSYEQRIIRNTENQVAVSGQAMEIARYCKDEGINGFGKLYVQESMLHNSGKTEQKVAAVADFDRVLLGRLGFEEAELPSELFRCASAILSEAGELHLHSEGVRRLTNIMVNHWVSREPQKLSDAFATHDLDKIRYIVRSALNSAGCLMPAEHLKGVLTGKESVLPAELQNVIDRYLDDAANRFLEQGHNSDDDLEQFIRNETSACYPAVKEPDEKALEEKFREKFRRAPKVTHEILRAYQIQHPVVLTEEHIREIVDGFNLKSFQTIVNAHSHILMNMSRYIDFASVKSAHLQIFATKDLDIGMLEQRGFFTWYNAHKSTNASELYELLSCDIETFLPEETAKNLTKRNRLKRSYEEVENIRQRLGIDFENNDIAVKGREITVSDGRYTVEICDKDDPRQTTSGYDTDCCQHLGGAGESCVKDILTNPLSCNLIITDNQTGKIVAQSYVWSDVSRDALVLDNMEFERSHDATARKFFPLVAKWCEQMPQKNIHIGTGYNQSFRGVGVPVSSYNFCHRTEFDKGFRRYSDYHCTGSNGARVLKQDGIVTFPVNEHATVRRKELKDSVLENICSPEDFSLFELPDISSAQDVVDYKEKAAACDDENWVRAQIQSLILTKHMELLNLFAEIPDDLQEQIFTTDATAVPFISHPSDSVLRKYLTLNPRAITNYPDIDANIVKHLYAQNGLLVRKAPTNDLSCQKAAVKNEPLAVIYLKESPIFGELLLMAVQKDPGVIKFFPDADDSYWNKAIYRDPFVIRYKKHPTRWQKETAIKKNPAVVYSIRNARKEDFALAKDVLRNYRGNSRSQPQRQGHRNSRQTEDAEYNPFYRM